MELLIILLMIGLPVWAQANIKNVIGRYSQVRAMCGLTGREVAQYILDAEGITDVEVKPTRGQLTDNFNPGNKTVNLSEGVYDSSSLAAVCIAAHEVGHAIQHHEKYAALATRNLVFPFARTGGQLATISILIGFLSTAYGFVYFGIICLGAILALQVVTLPVEYNASSRAMTKLENLGLLNGEELKGGSAVLRAAALTYLMAAISTLLNIMRLLMVVGNRD